MANEAEQAIYQRLASAPLFHPASVELLPEDWGIETGDVVSVKSGDETYNVPVYSHTLVWNGKSKATIESTGNQEREPLPELRRKEYQQGHATYTGLKAQKQEIDEHWVHVTDVTDKGLSDSFGILGVSLGADGMPMKDASGNYIWDDTGTGGEIWGHLNRTAWSTQILNNIKDANGKIVSLGEVYTDAYGNVIINAINDQRTGSLTINADRIDINGVVTALESYSIGCQSLQAEYGISTDNLTTDGHIYCQDNIYCSLAGYFSSLYVGASDTGGGVTPVAGGTSVSDAYKALKFIEDPQNNGRFILQGKTLANPNTWVDTDANFNIAATQFYIDGVAAAYERGKSEGSASSANIDLANSGQIYLHTADPGSGYTNLGSLGSKITEGKSNGSAYVSFQATCDGGKTYKYYKIPL